MSTLRNFTAKPHQITGGKSKSLLPPPFFLKYVARSAYLMSCGKGTFRFYQKSVSLVRSTGGRCEAGFSALLLPELIGSLETSTFLGVITKVLFATRRN